ncbi:hypothetical protein [Pectobacterium parmentieri]|uniref:hypothetical protein n=1 Tax=Pectobacterium parmentieri TaxID=1905730 RepID=UPI002031058F|nr:hypothetical protein [Pectobacterium parmentieri]MCL6381554.1 hypothetical protein [Pectobacterium parmentieri]
MSDVTTQEIDDALELAQTLKETAEEFIDIANGINNAERIRLEEERCIDIDSQRWVSLDDIPLGEEVLRVKDDMSGLNTTIQTLENLAEGKVPAADVNEKLQEAMEVLETVEGTLQEVRAKEVINASQAFDKNGFYHEQDDGEYDEEEDE